ncbi:MAG TPA: hypothetical protein VIV40_30500 [Kofleriaceae bacterium]
MRPSHVRIVALIAALLVTARTAAAHPPPELAEPEPTDWHHDRAFFEWSTWIRLGFGVERVAVDSLARSTTPPPTHEQQTMFDGALGADLTLPIPTRRIRLGPWIELRPQGVFAGAEVSIAGSPLDMFWYEGERVYTVRAGSSMTDVTAAVAWGYRCPWKLWGPYNDTTRYMIGVRLVASATRAVADPNDWSMSLGLEFEPIGSLRYVAGIKSWY